MTDPYAPFWLNIYKDGTDLQFPYRTSDVKAMAYRFRVIPWRPNGGSKPDLPIHTTVRLKLRNGMIGRGQVHFFRWQITDRSDDIISYQIQRSYSD